MWESQIYIVVSTIRKTLSNMIFRTPTLDADDREVLALIDRDRQQLRHYVAQSPARWQGSLRRSTQARALQGSNSIEGYDADLDQAAEIVDDEKPETIEEETYRALVGYKNSMTYILRMHDDPYFKVEAQVIRSIHFMMLNYDLTKMPGQWRPGPIFVVNEPSGDIVYEGPPADKIPPLIDELVDQLNEDHEESALIRGAMAHLNLVMIHPFKDGNGRMARALQTLVIARDGILHPIFSSIEEWLGRNTRSYYDILAETGKGERNPGNDAKPWVKFCLKAHYQQGATLIRRNREFGAVWDQIMELLRTRSLPSRSDGALLEAAFGFKIRNSRYRQENNVSDVVASRDLKKLCDSGLLEPVGDKRGRYYIASDFLKDIRRRVSEPKRRIEDPYDVVAERRQPSFL